MLVAALHLKTHLSLPSIHLCRALQLCRWAVPAEFHLSRTVLSGAEASVLTKCHN